MPGTRALFASIGASVLLVAAAALSLLAVSALFAFGGWSDPVADSSTQTALVLADEEGRSQSATQKAFVLPRRAQARAPRTDAGTTVRSPRIARSTEQAGITRSATSRPPKASFSTPPVQAPEAQTVAPPAPAAPKPTAGDRVRTGGEDLSGTVQNTADALARITDPLLPPVAAATQKVLNAVAELLARSTAGLAGTVDRVLAPR